MSSRRLEELPPEYKVQIPEKFFVPVFYPYLWKIYNYMVLYGGQGAGKCFAKGTEIIMYDGSIKRIEDICTGDLLMGPDSAPRRVGQLHRGNGQLYRVHQNKGLDYVVNAEHILCLKKANTCEKGVNKKRRYPDFKKYIEISVKDYLQTTKRWKIYFTGYKAEIDFAYKNVDIDPYILGVWLGDGTSASIEVTTEDTEVVHAMQNYAESIGHTLVKRYEKGKASLYAFRQYKHSEEIKIEIAKLHGYAQTQKHGYYTKTTRSLGFSRRCFYEWKKDESFQDLIYYYEKHIEKPNLELLRDRANIYPLLDRFRQYDLINNKHIPDDYLHNDRHTRLEVLAGLLDTDGSLHGACFDIIQKNKLLADQIVYLANSLGLRADARECTKTCVNNGVSGTYYRICISGNTQIIPTRIARKQVVHYSKRVDPLSTGITVTESHIGDYYGFEVDKDRKFLLKDFTVVHNSVFVGQMLALQMTVLNGRNLVCLRKQKTDCIKSCWGYIYNALKAFKLLKFWEIRQNPEHVMINRNNGNQILFEGVDNIEDIKSIKFTKIQDIAEGDDNLTDVWYEEANAESNKDVIEELDSRLRDPGIKCRLILTFNPVPREHWLCEYVTRDLALPGVDSLVLKTTYHDNIFLDPSYGVKLERFKYTDPYRYNVYVLGNWGVTGETVFNKNKIANRINQLQDIYISNPPVSGQFSYEKNENYFPVKDSYVFNVAADGPIKIYKMPERRHPYVLVLDTAGEGVDHYAAHVIDNHTDDWVASYFSNEKPDICVWQAYGLAVMYNYALYCPEANFDSFPIQAFLKLDYPNMYRRAGAFDKRHRGKEEKYGWVTGPHNRQTMLSDFKAWSEENIQHIYDVELLQEMLTFTVQTKKLKGVFWAAEPGAFDDSVMAAAIGLQAREQQTTELEPDRTKLVGKWDREELEEAIKDGRIDRRTAKEYVDSNGYYDEPLKDYTVKRRSRYAR